MDQINSKQCCAKHPNNSLEFIQIREISNHQDEKCLFYCTLCINEDFSFKGFDYLLINQIISSGSTQIIPKWPPINDQSIINQLIEATSKAQSNSSVEQSMINFFSSLKTEIANKIDQCQKKMVNILKDYPIDNQSIIKRYQQISKICELQELLSNSQTDFKDKEKSYIQLITSVEDKKEQNTQDLLKLVEQTKKQQSLINFELPNQMKLAILQFIEQISFFQSDPLQNEQQSTNQGIHNIRKAKISDRIVELISNKSNYCSNQFLNAVKQKLQQLNPLLESISKENQFEEIKKPMDFSQLSNTQFEMIEKQVNHFTQMTSNREYENQIKNSPQIKSIKKIIENKANFLNSNFSLELEKYLIDTYPSLTMVNFTHVFTQNELFQDISKLSIEVLTDLITLSKRITNPNNLSVNNDQLFEGKVKNDKQIFDILNKYSLSQYALIENDILDMIELIKGGYNNGKQLLIFNNLDNNRIEIYNSKSMDTNCVSNLNLERNKKYIFRFQIKQQNIEEGHFLIGLMRAEDIDTSCGATTAYLSSHFTFNKQTLQDKGDYGITNLKKGKKGFKLDFKHSIVLELRVCLQEQILEISDYPNQSFILAIEDKYKKNLLDYENLRLYIDQITKDFKIILSEALIVRSFNL